MTDDQVEEAARLFGLLAESARLYLLRALMDGPASVGELVEATGLKQGTASKHLGILFGGRFLKRQRNGLQVVYEISDPAIFRLCELMCDRMARDVRSQKRRLCPD